MNNSNGTQAATTTRFSYEFFPPRKPEQQRRFWRTVGCLETLEPSVFSVTYGALGSASEASMEIVKDLLAESHTPTAAHLTCLGFTESSMQAHLDRLSALGVKHIVALRGDLAEGQIIQAGELQYAEDLVKQITDHDTDFEISVAAYPETHPDARSAEADLDNLKRKMDAGASRALTQFFYDTDSFLRFRDKAAAVGITQQIVPGVLPIHDIEKVMSFSARCGAVVPADVAACFEKHADDASASHQYSVAHCVNLCELLQAEGVDDFHFYTLNQSNLAHDVTRVMRGEIDVPRSLAAA